MQLSKKVDMCKLHKSTGFDKKSWTNHKNVLQKLSTIQNPKSPKNGVIHEVIHVIHKNVSIFHTFQTGKNEQLFCEDVINFAKNGKNLKMRLTIQK